MRKYFYLLLILVTCYSNAYPQDSTTFYSATLLGAASTPNSPFWINANAYGAIPSKGSFLSARASIHKIYNPNNPRFFQWSGGAEVVANASKQSSVFFTDLFIAGKAGPVELSIGQRKEFLGLADSLLTTGSIAMSSNYRPYPKIQIATPQFVNIIPGNDILSFKFSYSDGLLGSAGVHYGNVTQVPEIYMHQKSLYLKLGKRRHRLNLYAGFNHQAIWGGEDKIFTGGLKKAEAYEYVILGKSWLSSRVGNHLGTIDIGAEWKSRDWTIFVYRQSIYEDGSLANLSNVADGLNGIRLKRKNQREKDPGLKLNTILFEFVYTKNQGGAVFDFKTGTFGRDNYFNHYVYNQGWSYKGRTLGTPLIAPQNVIRKNLMESGALYTVNNQIIAYHLGTDVSWKKINFLFKGTYSMNFGTYKNEYDPYLHQTSLLIRAETGISNKKTDHLSIAFAGDIGQFYPNNAAIMLGWRKSGFIK
jgi:hypothetical protein